MFNHTLDRVVFPSSLESLTLGRMFNQRLKRRLFPQQPSQFDSWRRVQPELGTCELAG